MVNFGRSSLEGVYTAIVTPFNEHDEVDWPALAGLVEFQIASGVNGVVPCGTTGESPTLSHDEHHQVVEFVTKKVAGRVLVIAGTGSNSTKEAISLSQHAENVGVDACLVVNPYYNKPTQEGLYRHFRAVCEAVKIPVVLYNIKGRTGVNVETATLKRIAADSSNLIGVKEASGDLTQIAEVIRELPKSFQVLSGDDNLTYEIMQMGGCGVISVASNIIPKTLVDFVQLLKDRNFNEAKSLSERLLPFFNLLFIETNPIPIKAALAKRGFIKEIYRLPLCEISEANRKQLFESLSSMPDR